MVVVLFEKRKETADYIFWRQFNEEPSCILGCPGVLFDSSCRKLDRALGDVIAAVFVLGAVPRNTFLRDDSSMKSMLCRMITA